MTKGKTLFGAMLLALVLFWNSIPTAFAQEQVHLSMTAEKTNVLHGDSVTVTVKADSGFVTCGAGMTVVYDHRVLEPVLEDSSALSPFTLSAPVTVKGQKAVRVSFYPASGECTLTPGTTVAELTFRTLKPANASAVEMTAAYFYGRDLQELTAVPAEPVNLKVQAIPVEKLVLNSTEREMEINSTGQLIATVLPENASNKTVTWESSDPEKVSVDKNGLLTALDITEEGSPVIITARADKGKVTARCSVTVVYPPDVGYVVSVPAGRTRVVGETVDIPLTVTNTRNEKTYNAFDITLTYDPQHLYPDPKSPVTGAKVTDLTVEQGEGSIHLLGYGEPQTLNGKKGAVAFTLNFKALKTGSSYVSIVDNARVDNSANAVISNAAKAALKKNQGRTLVSIDKFTVTLYDGLSGDPVADPAEPYDFWDSDQENRPFYDYSFYGTMGDRDLKDSQVIRNADGSFTVKKVTGHLVIRATRVGKKYDVYFPNNAAITGVSSGTGSGEGSRAQFGFDYEVRLNREEGYRYEVDIFIGGRYYTTMTGDTYRIPGEDIRGDITFEVTKTPIDPGSGGTDYQVTFRGSGAEDADYVTTGVARGSSYSFRLNKEPGYSYSVTFRMGGGKESRIIPENGRYIIENVQGDLIITVEKELQTGAFFIEISPYVTLDRGETMYLVLVNGTLDDTELYTYGGSPMYYSEAYGAWCILTVRGGSLYPGTVRPDIAVRPGRMEILEAQVYDVNMTGLVDINDAQLVYDLYNGKYKDFTKINMQRFLNADVVADKRITVADAAAVVSQIH